MPSLIASYTRYVCHILVVSCKETNAKSYEDIGVTLLGPTVKMAIDVVQVISYITSS